MNISPFDRVRHFKQAEFDSPDLKGSGANMDIEFIIRLDCLRGALNRPFVINSGFRTRDHNRKVDGSPRSAHLMGKAADISTRGWTEQERWHLLEIARNLGFNGIGIANTFIHLDTMPRKASWRYTVNGQEPVEIGLETDFA